MKEELRIRVEVVEMAYEIEAGPFGGAGDSKQGMRGGRSRNLFSKNNNLSKEAFTPSRKPPCVHCGGTME